MEGRPPADAFLVVPDSLMPTIDAIKRVLTESTLRRLAGAISFERGQQYFARGHVINVVEHAGRITAKVIGTAEYQVSLAADGDQLDYDCSCPMGMDGAFCKHCVAVGLAWLADKRGSKTATTPVVTLDDARAWLLRQKKETLADLLLQQAAEDDRLRERLLLQSAKSAGPGVSVAAIRKAIDRATNTHGFVDYRASYEFSRGICDVVESIADLLKAHHAAEVIELSEHALTAVENAILHMDDSAGNMGGILERLQELHLAACREARPDPEQLAARLFQWEMDRPWDTFRGGAATYEDVLGERGLATYRRLAETDWARMPEVGPGEKDLESFGKRFHLTHIMETLARQSGDIEALVAIKSRDLSLAYRFLQIAEVYREAGEPDKALAWAERGLKAFPEQTDHRLREFLAAEYHRRERHDEAMELIWTGFAERASLKMYQQLKEHADLIGQWPRWREQALGFIRAGIEQQKKQAALKPKGLWAWPFHRSDHSELVQIFLWENEVEAAWKEAQTGGCGDNLWMELAAKREQEVPAEVVPIYQKQVERFLDQRNNSGYAEAVKLLARIRGLMVRLGREGDFTTYLADVRARHKPKRNFIKLAERL